MLLELVVAIFVLILAIAIRYIVYLRNGEKIHLNKIAVVEVILETKSIVIDMQQDEINRLNNLLKEIITPSPENPVAIKFISGKENWDKQPGKKTSD